MRPLVLIDKYPLPASSGSPIRILHLLRGAAPLGPGELIVLADSRPTELAALRDELPGWEVTVVPPGQRSPRASGKLRWALGRTGPRAIEDHGPAETAAVISATMGDGPRLIFCMRSFPNAIGVLLARPHDVLVCDLEDIESVKLRRPQRVANASRIGQAKLLIHSRIEARAHQRVEQGLLQSAAAVLVCSEFDQGAIGGGVIVQNGTDLPNIDHDDKGPKVRDPATLLFVGQLSYGPNEAAAIRLATRILPLIQREVPAAEMRLVGRTNRRIESLADVPGVSVLGFVADLAPELARATAMVVPLTSGSGTRIKILESFANGVPVISTSIGAEGIDAQPFEHLLIADSDVGLATAVLEVIADPIAAAARAARAKQLIIKKYEWPSIEAGLTTLLRTLVASPPPRPPEF